MLERSASSRPRNREEDMLSAMSVSRLPLFIVLALTGSAFPQDHPLLSAGPMNAYAEMTEVAVWVQTKADARVRLHYWPQSAQAPAKAATQTIQTSAVGDHIAVFTIAGLPFGTKFDYEVEINGQVVPRAYPLRFQTQPLWRWQSEPPEFRIAFGSCAYFNDEPFDRPGRPYGGDHEIFDALAKKQPDMMLWLGDNVYYREADWLTESAMRYRWRHNRASPGLQPILGSAQHYATWDDHDYGPNDSDRSFRLKGEALRVFADYFPAVRYGTPETPGTFQRFEWGDVEFFMLDDRYHRTPNRMPVDDDRTMLGKAQLQWLKDSLVNSQAVFKVVVCGGRCSTRSPSTKASDSSKPSVRTCSTSWPRPTSRACCSSRAIGTSASWSRCAGLERLTIGTTSRPVPSQQVRVGMLGKRTTPHESPARGSPKSATSESSTWWARRARANW